jgi:hypothetical protein
LEREIAHLKSTEKSKKASEEAAFGISALPNCENTLKDELEGLLEPANRKNANHLSTPMKAASKSSQ